MTLFSLMISFVNHELVFAVDSICQPWLNFQRWFVDQHSHSVFDDSMPQTWIYFCYPFYASLVYSWTLSTPYVRCHSYFSGDFKVYGDSVFADDLWSVVTQISLAIPGVNDDSVSLMISFVNSELVFAVDSIRQPWFNFQRWFLVLQWLSFRWRFLVGSDAVFTDDSMRQRWLCFLYWFHPSTVN